MNTPPLSTDMDALFLALEQDYNNRMMAEEARREAIERAQEMDREAGPLDDEAVTDYRNRRGE